MEWILPKDNNKFIVRSKATCLLQAGEQSQKQEEDAGMVSFIQIKNLKKSFDKQEILKGIDLELTKGSITAIMDPRLR